QRHIRFITDDPAVVSRRDMKNVASTDLDDAAIVHCRRGAPRNYDAAGFHVATRLAERPADVLGPPPSGLVGRPAERHSTDVNDLELSLFERPNFIRIVESLQGHSHHRASM